jgi:hypothetical protein
MGGMIRKRVKGAQRGGDAEALKKGGQLTMSSPLLKEKLMEGETVLALPPKSQSEPACRTLRETDLGDYSWEEWAAVHPECTLGDVEDWPPPPAI